MRIILSLAVAVIIASPVLWKSEASASHPIACYHEGDAAVEGHKMSLCHKGVWETSTMDQGLLLEASR